MKVILKVKEVRLEKKYSLQKLSEKSGVSAIDIYKIENNLIDPTFSIMINLSRALDKSLNEMFYIIQ